MELVFAMSIYHPQRDRFWGALNFAEFCGPDPVSAFWWSHLNIVMGIEDCIGSTSWSANAVRDTSRKASFTLQKFCFKILSVV